MEYTEEIHAKRVMRMMERIKDPCSNGCPKARYYHADHNEPHEGWVEWGWKACVLCREFVGMKEENKCPCDALGKHEAIKHTWLALEEKGYLDEIPL